MSIPLPFSPRNRASVVFLVLLILLGIALLLPDGLQWLPKADVRFSRQPSNTPLPVVSEQIQHEVEKQPLDSIKKYERVMQGSDPEILWLVLTYDDKSWGLEPGLFRNRRRSIDNFLQLLSSTGVDIGNVTVGFMTSSEDEYHHFINITRDIPFGRFTVFLHPGFNADAVLDRQHRHDAAYQTARRAELAQLRNYLMLSALRDERHIIWLDADVYHLDNGIIQKMIAHSESRADAGIITARCESGGNKYYDRNAWAGSYKHAQIVPDIIKGTTDDDLLPLTAVGATLLYMRASLVRRGINFPPYYVIGTKWGEDGDDGIESEGICYQAKGLRDGGCFILGGSWHTKHGD